MEINYEALPNDISKITLIGRMDLQGTMEIETKLAAYTSGKGGKAIIDMSEVSFMASLGLRALIASAKTLSKKGGELVLAAPQPAVMEVLKVSGVYQLFKVYDTLDAAVASLT